MLCQNETIYLAVKLLALVGAMALIGSTMIGVAMLLSIRKVRDDQNTKSSISY